ncbi:MAG: hypothetical protein JOZ68_16710 [Acidimicrobiia bacterium]|nr:hypothetical protein [Acidimicrobiia bacterium]MBV9042645.1 hypothetical protein [Acidimicrobiia bacterium]
MGTIWTPGGEQPVGGEGQPGGFSGPNVEEPPPEELEAELAEVQRQLLETPASVIIANHAIGLFQLAALHLNQQPPNFVDAQLAIDALGSLVEGLGERLGPDAEALRDALAQIRLAFVQIKSAGGAPPPPTE